MLLIRQPSFNKKKRFVEVKILYIAQIKLKNVYTYVYINYIRLK